MDLLGRELITSDALVGVKRWHGGEKAEEDNE